MSAQNAKSLLFATRAQTMALGAGNDSQHGRLVPWRFPSNQELSLSNSGQVLLGFQGTALVTWNPVTSNQNLVLSNQEAVP